MVIGVWLRKKLCEKRSLFTVEVRGGIPQKGDGRCTYCTDKKFLKIPHELSLL